MPSPLSSPWVPMQPSANWSPPWVFYLTIGCLYGSVALRAWVNYRASPDLPAVAGLLAVWLLLFSASRSLPPQPPALFSVYLLLQAAVTLALLFTPRADDFLAALFGVLSMQLMQRLGRLASVGWISLFALLMAWPLVARYGLYAGLAFTLIYTFGSVLLAGYALAHQRAQQAYGHNQQLLAQVGQANRQLAAQARQRQQLAAARERQRLALDLHDAVTQTIFSMTLTTQSALLLLERDPARAGTEVDRLNQLAQSALAELRALTSELRPHPDGAADLAAAIHQHLRTSPLLRELTVTVTVDGKQQLTATEAQGLFRMVQEALNNVAKHAQTPRAQVRLHLAEPAWVEISDQGRGFAQPVAGGGDNLGSLRERAAKIGWALRVTSAPEAGTCVRVEQQPRRVEAG